MKKITFNSKSNAQDLPTIAPSNIKMLIESLYNNKYNLIFSDFAVNKFYSKGKFSNPNNATMFKYNKSWRER